MTERRPIPGLPGYLAATDGTIWSTKGIGCNPVTDRPPRLIKQHVKPNGYLFVVLWHNNKSATQLVHRVVLAAFSPCPDSATDCRHLDGNRQNNALENLRWGTRKENEADKVLHGTSNRGARNGRAKLSEENIKAIRKKRAAGVGSAFLAEEYGVHRETINAIARRKLWARL